MPAPAASSEPLLSWGTADVAAAAPSPSPTWSEPQPGGYFWLCITSQLTLPPHCHSPATHPHARPSSHACTRVCAPIVPGHLSRLCHTCHPPANPLPAPGLAGTAHHLASGRLAVMPGACRAWRAASPSHTLLLGYPRPGGLRFGPSLPQSCQGEATERLASSDGGVCPSSCSTCPWAVPAEGAPCASLLSACSALSSDTTLLSLQAAPAAVLLQGGLCPLWGPGCGCGPAQAGGCCNAEAGAADTAGRAWAAACTPMAEPWLAEPCPQQGGTIQSCCPCPQVALCRCFCRCVVPDTACLLQPRSRDGDVTLLLLGTVAEPGGDQGQEWLQSPWCRFLCCKDPLAKAGWWHIHCEEQSTEQDGVPILSPSRRFTPGVSPVAGRAVGE